MKNTFCYLFAALLCIFIIDTTSAEEFIGGAGNKSTRGIKQNAAGCSAASGFRFLDINNVRGRINTGGDMWWDLPGGIGAQYFIPKAGTATSLFSGALWIGGLDINGQLKLAAQRYRQVGIDYWPGPLTIDGSASVEAATCAKYDNLYLITRAEIDEFLAWWNSTNKTEEFPNYIIPKSIMDYPAHGDVAKNQSYYLAPFKDVDGDGDYDPNQGDYPYYDITNHLCPLNYADDPNYIPTPTPEDSLGIVHGGILVDQVLKGDQTLWWVFNDKGGYHSETTGAAIGLEIRAQAFAFTTNDEINNMTFYSYEIINRSTFTLTNTYYSPWCDTDLGYAWDDYIGCDVNRGLGYCYNGNAVDGSGESEAYGDQPPAIGVDFFQGPYIDPDGRDNPKFTGDCSIINSPYEYDQMAINGVNFGNHIIDDERFGMRRFVYHNNTGGNQGDPHSAPEYYNYLRGIWKDNTKMLYGGNAHITSGAVGPECDFMFPDDSDPCNWGTKGAPPNGGYNQSGKFWNEQEANNNPYDRRFMQSAGPFTLVPGAVNYITVGIPWARATSGGPWASVELLRVIDDKCQKLFDNCFKVLDGPDAPDLTFVELNKQLICYISNSKTSNNYLEKYTEYDNTITQPNANTGERNDSIYRFEGYQIYQLKDPTVTLESKDDPDLVRLVAEFDIRNGVGTLVNYYYDKAIGGNVPIVEVEGGDNGINHSFSITEDAFAITNRSLVNHKQYYYTAVSYAYNEYMPYSQDFAIQNGLLGQKLPYLAGRRNIKTITAIPHPTINGIVLHSKYGDGPQVTRIQGQGNGGIGLEITPETVEEIMSKPPADSTNTMGGPDYPIAYNAVYKYGQGPLNVKVVDPLNVKKGIYLLKFTNVTNLYDTTSIARANWQLTDSITGTVYTSDTTIDVKYEQLLLDIGLSIDIQQAFSPGDSLADNNGLIYSTVTYEDSSRRWLGGVEDNQIPASSENWIRSGTYLAQDNPKYNDWNMPTRSWDPLENYEKIANGTWAPYVLCAFSEQMDYNMGPAFNLLSKQRSQLSEIASVDIVITADKSKWTRSIVLEMCADHNLSEGGAHKFDFRKALSVNKEGVRANPDDVASNNPDDPSYINTYGMGWFPGYAINLETGERLNIMFGEDSWLVSENGRDMLWNPTSNLYENLGGYQNLTKPLFGGKHYVYILSHQIINLEVVGNTYTYNYPAYDACRYLLNVEDVYPTIPATVWKPVMFSTMMYVGMPLAVENEEFLSNEYKLSIRVSKPYKRYYSTLLDTLWAPTNTYNHNYPVYTFSTNNIATETYNSTKAEDDLDIINIVPNPYYAYSSYENNAIDNRVKITNLQQKCTITIYNINGTLIRQYTKDDASTYLDWDLKNFAGIPIASGLYIIHVKTDVGEKVLKWFGIIRPPDLNTF